MYINFECASLSLLKHLCKNNWNFISYEYISDAIDSLTLEGPVTVIVGGNYNYICTAANGNPAAIITWYKTAGSSDTQITANITSDIDSVGESHTVTSTFNYYPSKDDSVYSSIKCVADQGRGDTESNVITIDIQCEYHLNTYLHEYILCMNWIWNKDTI